MSTHHRPKRQFQPSISSFFPPSSTTTCNPTNSTTTTTTPLKPTIPTLPDPIQSSLLNVGMRVRKAVPEGYKTKTAEGSGYQDRHLSTIGNNSAGRAVAELVPFCGILKVGGFGVQEDVQAGGGYGDGRGWDAYEGARDSILHSVAFGGMEEEEEVEGNYGFPSSQETVASSVSTDSVPAALSMILPSRNRKRAFDDEEGDDEDDHGNVSAATSIQQPTSFPQHAPFTSVRPRNRRPNRPRRRFVPLRSATSASMSVAECEATDFGEAEFLRPEVEVEVEERERMDLDEV